MGRGRTTTGMVIATLIYLNRIGASGNFSVNPDLTRDVKDSHA